MPSAVATTMLTNATSAGAGTTADLLTAKANVSMSVFVTGTVTGGSVALQASQDGTNWITVGSAKALRTGNQRSCQLAGGVYRFFRANIVTAITGGGTVSATLMEAG